MLDSKETVSSVLQKCRSSSGAVEKGLEESPARSTRVGWPSTACLFVLAIDFLVIFHILDKHLLASSLVSEILNTRDNRKVWPNKRKALTVTNSFALAKRNFKWGSNTKERFQKPEPALSYTCQRSSWVSWWMNGQLLSPLFRLLGVIVSSTLLTYNFSLGLCDFSNWNRFWSPYFLSSPYIYYVLSPSNEIVVSK
jgi:hypothetical protein